MILTKEQLPAFYQAIKDSGHECNEEEGKIWLKLPENMLELWIVSKIEGVSDLYEVRWSNTAKSSADEYAKIPTSPHGTHIIKAAWQKATQQNVDFTRLWPASAMKERRAYEAVGMRVFDLNCPSCGALFWFAKLDTASNEEIEIQESHFLDALRQQCPHHEK